MRFKGNRILLCTAIISISAFTLLLFAPARADAARDWGGYMWKVEGKRIFVCDTAGKWRTGIRAMADGAPGDSIQMGTSKSVSNSISSTCGLSNKVLNASFKFDVSRSWSATASKTYGLTGKSRGSWWAIQYKPIHKKYKLKVRQYSFINGKWQRTAVTKWLYAKRFDHFAYRLVKSSAPN